MMKMKGLPSNASEVNIVFLVNYECIYVKDGAGFSCIFLIYFYGCLNITIFLYLRVND